MQPGTSSKCNTTAFTIPIDVVLPTGTVTVVKEIIGFNDPGLFNLLVNGNAVAPNVGDGGQGTSGIINPGTPVTVTETAGTGTNLGNYTSSLACETTILLPTANSMMPNQGGVTCTFTNTRATNSVTLTKSWVNSTAGDTTTLVISGDQVTNTGPVLGNSTAPTGDDQRGGNGIRWLEVNLAEMLGPGNFGSYTASLACKANGSPLRSRATRSRCRTRR